MPKIRNIIIFTVITIVLILIYVVFIRSSEDDTGSLVTTSPTSTDGAPLATSGDPAVAGDFLNLLLSVKSIKLEDSIFANPAFISLRDSSIVLIPDGTEGRPNPFAPIGEDDIPESSATPATPTLPPSLPMTTPLPSVN